MAALQLPRAQFANYKFPPTRSEKISLHGESLSVRAVKTKLVKKEIQRILCQLNLLHPPLLNLQYLAKPQPQQQVTFKYLRQHLQILLWKVVKNQVHLHQAMCRRNLL